MFWIGTTVSAEPPPKPAGGEAGGQAALVGEPFQRIADAGAVDAARADAGDDLGDVEGGEAGGIGVDHPADAAQDAADENHEARPVLVDEPTLDRHQPGLEQHERVKAT
jgi:hypothetical protein